MESVEVERDALVSQDSGCAGSLWIGSDRDAYMAWMIL